MAVRYYLDGAEKSAAEIAGQSGLLGISIDISQNPLAEPLFFAELPDDLFAQLDCGGSGGDCRGAHRKLFGIINVVDLLVLLAVLLVGGAIVWQLLGDRVSDAVSPQAELTAVVAIAGAHPDLVEEALRQELAGQKLVSGLA